MKKKLIATGLAALLLIAGCGNKESDQSGNDQTAPSMPSMEETAPVVQDNAQNGQQAPNESEEQEISESQEQESAEDKEIGFVFEIDDVFALTGRGTVVTGTVASGSVKDGDTVFVVKEDGTELETKVAGIEVFGRMIEEAAEGDSVGIGLDGLEKDQVAAGDRLVGYWGSAADSIVLNPVYTFEVE